MLPVIFLSPENLILVDLILHGSSCCRCCYFGVLINLCHLKNAVFFVELMFNLIFVQLIEFFMEPMYISFFYMYYSFEGNPYNGKKIFKLLYKNIVLNKNSEINLNVAPNYCQKKKNIYKVDNPFFHLL